MKHSARNDFGNSNFSYGGHKWALPLTSPIIKDLAKEMDKLLIETNDTDKPLNDVYQ